MPAYSVYIHVPFCTHRCAYCDFNTYAGQHALIPAYVDAVKRELEYVGAQAREPIPVHTVFFGGGTPSLLSPAQVGAILEAVRRSFTLQPDAELTMEANPGTVSERALAELRGLGINRISFGAQSANGEELRMLERTHTFLDVMTAVRMARHAGFGNLNIDLIYGLPEQQLETWKSSVKRVLDLGPEHVSAYALTVEHGTPFGRWSERGLLPMPDPDAAAEMYEWASEALEAAGLEQYEISNWARAGRACVHNLQYWRGQPYLGVGAGAHGYAGGYRYANALRIPTYIQRLTAEAAAEPAKGPHFPLSPAAVNQHRQSEAEDMAEFMITGLRLTREGIRPAEFRARFGCELGGVYGEQVRELVGLGLLELVRDRTPGPEEDPEVLRLTKWGRLLGNQVFVRFV